MVWGLTFARGIVAGCVVLALGSLGAFAQVSTPGQQQGLDGMAAQPTDHDNTFSYVRESTDQRDYEAAIAALERILVYNPNLTRARYELGVLYFKQRSYHQAALQFEELEANPDLDPTVRSRLSGFLIETRKQLQASRFTAILQLGLRYNSNVTSAPGGGLVRSNGVDLVLPRADRSRGDGSAFALGRIEHVFDFQNQRGDRWESTLDGYLTKQFKEDDFDVGLLSFDTGPRLALAPEGWPGLTIRPSIMLGLSAINGERYIASYGGGLEFGIPVSNFVSFDTGVKVSWLDVKSPSFAPARGVRSKGTLVTAYLGSTISASETVTLKGQFFHDWNIAEGGNTDTRQFGFKTSMAFTFDPPTELIGYQWTLQPYASFSQVDFDRADPAIDADVVRRDRQLRLGLQLDAPITDLFGVSGSVEYTRNYSNLPNFRSSGWSAMLGPTVRF